MGSGGPETIPYDTLMPWIAKQSKPEKKKVATKLYLITNQKQRCTIGIFILGTLSKARRQRQRERHQIKGLLRNFKTIAVHVRYKSLYISLPSSAKRQREITKYCVFWRT